MRTTPASARLFIIPIGAATLFAACQSGHASRGGSGSGISLDEFVGASAGSLDSGESISSAPVDSAPAPREAGMESSLPDSASDEPLPPPDPGEEVVVDSLVGQINGRPVYADAFFAPLDDRLRTLSAQLTPGQFATALRAAVHNRMIEIVQNDLLLAQAQSRLTGEQQQGLLAWLRQRQEDLVRSRGGTVETARRAYREEEGVTLEAELAETRDIALIQMIYQQEIAPRVIVSWRDVERAYERNRNLINSPGAAKLGIIRLDPATDAAKIELATSRLAAGDNFMDVAKAVGMVRDGLMSDEPYALGPNGLSDAPDLFPLYREKLAEASAGDIVGPFDQTISGGPRRVWLHLIELTPAVERSIYDPEIQTSLRNGLLQERRAEEQMRYFNDLLGEDVTADIKEIEGRLEAIGFKRYRR